MQQILEEHKLDMQRIIEKMPSGTEMLLRELVKQVKIEKVYPAYSIFEEVQRILKLNLGGYKFFKRMNILESIISRTEDYV